LTPAPLREESECVLVYIVHASVGGKIAQLGQRLVDGAAKSMADDFFKRFDVALQAMHPAEGQQEGHREGQPEGLTGQQREDLHAQPLEVAQAEEGANAVPASTGLAPEAPHALEKSVANNGVPHAEKPEFDPITDLKLPWWVWLTGAGAAVVWFIYDLFE
jgi:uncharacterized protein